MPRYQPILNNFSNGEWSSRMDGRTDLEAYYRSCRILLNFIIASQGGGDRRPGSYFTVNTKTDGDKARLAPFSIKGVGEYVLELGDEYMRFIKCSTHEQIVSGTPVEISTPWAKADLFELMYAQTPTELLFVQSGYAPQKLTRTSDTSWAISPPTFSGWDDSSEKDISAATQADPVQITATAHGLVTGDVVYISDVLGMIELNCLAYKITKVDDDNFTLDDIDGLSYTAYVSGGTVKKEGNIFGSAGNYPSAIGFYQQRLILAGTENHPDYIWCSKVGDFLDFKLPDALLFKVEHDRGLAIKWLAGKTKTIFGADSCEGVMGGEPLSDTNYQLNVESGFGSADIQGRLINELITYVQDGGKKVRGFSFSQDNQGWLSSDLTLYADHITGEGIIETEVQRNPNTILWGVRSDGALIGFTYELQYGIAGWHRHIIGVTSASGDAVESIAIVRGSVEDEIWLSVKRTVNGTTKRFIEYFKPRDYGSNQEDAYFVDCGVSVDKGDAVSITGITQAHPVVVTAPGHSFVAGDKVRIWGAGGSVELNGEVWKVQNPVGDTFEIKETDDFSSWSSTQTYYKGAIVERNLKNYVALQESLNKDPETETEYWSLWPTAYISGGYAREVVNTISGLSHLEGESLQVCVDGSAHPNRTVSSGSITLDDYYSVIHAGLGYNSDLKPMRLEGGAAYGTAQGKTKRVHSVGVRVYKSLGCKVGSGEDDLTQVLFRKADDKMGSAPELFTGDVPDTYLPSGFGKDGNVFIRQDQPLPLNILAILPEFVTND